MAIDRLCINFMDNCNMKCPYCYIPFINERVDFILLKKIIEKCSKFEIKVITFGGGDPFNYKEFIDIVKVTYNMGIEVHIDTNGINIKDNYLTYIDKYVSLIALPIDASTGALHSTIRNYEGNHLQIVLNRLKSLQSLKCSIKINTVVCKYNLHDIGKIYNLIKNYKLKIWSLYQFWPLHDAEFYKSDFEISDLELENSILPIRNKHNLEFLLEVNPISTRYRTYLFSSPNGKVYTHDIDNPGKYVFLGSFFDDQWIAKWSSLEYLSIRNLAKTRYKSDL